MISRDIPMQPWSKLGADIFTFDQVTILITVDYYSKFCELDCFLQDTRSRTVINQIKAHFARRGIPMRLVIDNGLFIQRICRFCQKVGF